MDEQHRRPEKVDHAYPVHNPPNAGMGAHEERVAALQEAVNQEEESSAHGRGPGVPVRVCVVLRKALVWHQRKQTLPDDSKKVNTFETNDTYISHVARTKKGHQIVYDYSRPTSDI